MPSPDYTEQDRGWKIAKEGQEEGRRRVTTHSTIVSNSSDHNINNNNSSQQQFWASRSEQERPSNLTGSRSRSEQVKNMGYYLTCSDGVSLHFNCYLNQNGNAALKPSQPREQVKSSNDPPSVQQ
jgi:hypothetical protein